MMRFLLILAVALTVTGCGGLSTRQAQNVSDGLAGIDAARPRVDDTVAGAALDGARNHVAAVAEGQHVPPPKRDATAITADPQGYLTDAKAALADAATRLPWWGWLVGSLATVAGVLRFFPGPTEVIADMVWGVITTGRARQADATQAQHAAAFQHVMSVVDSMANTQTVADLKTQVLTRLPSGAQSLATDLLLAWIATRGGPVSASNRAVPVPDLSEGAALAAMRPPQKG
jgi:hypothetical protein